MADLLSPELVRKAVVCDQIVLTVGYDNEGVPKENSRLTATAEKSPDCVVQFGDF
jgi:hypothetical protein